MIYTLEIEGDETNVNTVLAGSDLALQSQSGRVDICLRISVKHDRACDTPLSILARIARGDQKPMHCDYLRKDDMARMARETIGFEPSGNA